jgi:hypothetical protein
MHRLVDVVFHHRKRIIEVVQEFAPTLVLGRLAETFGVTLQGVPPHEQEILVDSFHAPFEFMPLVACARRNNLLSF